MLSRGHSGRAGLSGRGILDLFLAQIGSVGWILARASGIARTALRQAVLDLSTWTTLKGESLIVDGGGFTYPDLAGPAARFNWPAAVRMLRFEH